MKNVCRFVLFVLAALAFAVPAAAQVTTGSLNGKVQNARQEGVSGASVIAIHLPSGSTYEATSRDDGRFQINNMRVGGPYSVTVAYTGSGGAAFAPETIEDVVINLGVATDIARRRKRPDRHRSERLVEAGIDHAPTIWRPRDPMSLSGSLLLSRRRWLLALALTGGMARDVGDAAILVLIQLLDHGGCDVEVWIERRGVAGVHNDARAARSHDRLHNRGHLPVEVAHCDELRALHVGLKAARPSFQLLQTLLKLLKLRGER